MAKRSRYHSILTTRSDYAFWTAIAAMLRELAELILEHVKARE